MLKMTHKKYMSLPDDFDKFNTKIGYIRRVNDPMFRFTNDMKLIYQCTGIRDGSYEWTANVVHIER